MSRLYMSNQMETLCGKLAANLNPESGSIFSKTMIITQGGGMNHWLTRELTQKNGVFANYQFQNQDGFMGQVYQLLTGEKLRSNRDAIKFGVYRLLDSDQFKEKFKDVADYYEGNDLRRIQLSEKIADLFDQYQLYRKKMIKSWDDGKPHTGLETNKEAEEWQMWLWQKLEIPSKATLRNEIYDKLESVENWELLKNTYPAIHLFGISIYTSFHLEFYKRLSDYINVHFYLCLPSQAKEYNHTLLESFGTKAKELLEQFEEIEEKEADFTLEETGTLLNRLQQSILNNEELKVKEEELTEKDEDDSIQITSHFTAVREVEALYNYLLDLFENDEALKPRDVVVIAPDINKYEPFIRAVFRNAPVKLPHRISGAVKTTGDSITASLELISNMSEEDLTAENVVGLLEQNRIGKAYRIEDTGYIRGVLNKAGIRFGRTNRLEDDTHFVSWKYGLEKIILGYAMLTEDAYNVSYRLTEDEKNYLGEEALTNYPYKDAEASASHDLLRLKAFVDDLQDFLDEQQTPRTLAQWKLLFVEKVMEKMVWSNDFDKEDRLERNEIFRALGFTERLDEAAGEEEVPWQVFLNALKKRLFTESREHDLNTGSITFTSAIPARGLPYKVIAFIGLDNGVFPRQDQHLGFDLMGSDYKPGDRSKKEADKSLFLDTLMSAREKIYLSYIGQGIKDNTEIPPSIVLDTLMDYLDLKPTEHPLHGFSNRYNDEELFTYLYNNEPDSNVHKTKKPDDSTDEKTEEIWVNDFVKFFEAPIDWYFNKVLGIKYDGDEDDTLQETEIFELDPLQQWKVKNELLKLKESSPEELDALLQKYIKHNKLPLKNLGRAILENLLEEIKPVKEKLKAETNNQDPESKLADIEIGNTRIRGEIENVFSGKFVSWAFSEGLKHELRGFLASLLLSVDNLISSSVHIKKDGNVKVIQIMTGDEPFDRLKKLLEYIEQGKKAPLKFSLDAAKAIKDQDINDEKTLKKALEAFRKEAYKLYEDDTENKYTQVLFDEGYFDDFSKEDLKKIQELAGLLNLYA